MKIVHRARIYGRRSGRIAGRGGKAVLYAGLALLVRGTLRS